MCKVQTTADRPALSHTILAHESTSGLVQAESRMLTADSYSYDPFGRRLWKDVGGTRTNFMYADEGLIAEFDGNGSETKGYGYAPNSTWTTNPLYMKEGSEYFFYHNDHLGTPQKMTSVNGSTVWSAKYESFGKAAIDPISTIVNNLRFPGQYCDSETGFHYNYHRYYDAKTGRYLRTDPNGIEGGLNLFAYANNSPPKITDVYGLSPYLDPGHLRHYHDCGSDEINRIDLAIGQIENRLRPNGCIKSEWLRVSVLQAIRNMKIYCKPNGGTPCDQNNPNKVFCGCGEVSGNKVWLPKRAFGGETCQSLPSILVHEAIHNAGRSDEFMPRGC